MTNKRMTRAELIRWLGDAIRTETAKPFDEIDYDLVDECGNLLDELMDPSAVLSEEEIAARAANVLPGSVAAVRTQPKIKLRRFWKIAVAAAVVLCMAVTVMSVPTWRQAILTALHLGVGDSTNVDGITCVRNGVEQSYSSIDELVENEKLDFKPPMAETKSLQPQKVICVDDANTIYFCFEDTTITYEIWLDNTAITPYISNAKEQIFNGYTTYIVPDEIIDPDKYYSYTIIDNDIHMIYSTIETIELLINSINGD
ncbi:MAG: hypothetical protein IJ325_13925 [Clostridia bacterium]|nr:hypothetical protein [Clostridia bacterium]